MIHYYETDSRMSDVVEYAGVLYVGGQICVNRSGVKEQAEGTLAIIENLLNKYGSDKAHILNAMIYLSDMKDLPLFNEVWDAWVAKGRTPARACVEAKMAQDTCLVEVCVIAAKNT